MGWFDSWFSKQPDQEPNDPLMRPQAERSMKVTSRKCVKLSSADLSAAIFSYLRSKGININGPCDIDTFTEFRKNGKDNMGMILYWNDPPIKVESEEDSELH